MAGWRSGCRSGSNEPASSARTAIVALKYVSVFPATEKHKDVGGRNHDRNEYHHEGLRTEVPPGPTMNFQNPWAMHPEENSHAQASRNGGAILSTVNSARMKQIAFEIRPIFPHSASSWPDDAPPICSAFARHGQDLRISVQIARRRGIAPGDCRLGAGQGMASPPGRLVHSQLLGKRYRLCHNMAQRNGCACGMKSPPALKEKPGEFDAQCSRARDRAANFRKGRW